MEGEGRDGGGEDSGVGFAGREERGRVGEEVGVERGEGGEAGIGLVCHSAWSLLCEDREILDCRILGRSFCEEAGLSL